MEPDIETVIESLRDTDPKQVAVLCDFDGTISVRDIQVGILERFARPDWRAAEAEVLKAGRKSYHYLPVVYSGWSASENDVISFIDEFAEMDPGFVRFYQACHNKRWHFEIVSDGLNLYVSRMLEANRLDIPYFSNVIAIAPDGVRFEHPNYNPACGLCGSCKKARVDAARAAGAAIIIYAGDGISDECVADKVDILFAKNSLLSYCTQKGIPSIPYQGFKDIYNKLFLAFS